MLSLFFTLVVTQSIADQSVEEIIKGRKALFSKNYSTAKRVQALSSNGDFDKAKELMIEMSENYKTLIGLFPENTIEGFRRTIELGISTLELDIVITEDLIPIVYHDFYVNPSLCLDRNGNSIDNKKSKGYPVII